MKLPIAIATLLVAAGIALPAFAVTPTSISASLRDAAATPFEAVAERTQARRQGQRQRNTRSYRNGSNAYAAQPRVRRSYQGSWGNCIQGVDRGARSAFPSWDRC